MLIDSHAHLTFPELSGQIETVLANCGQVGVDHVITIGTTPDDGRKAVELARESNGSVSAIVGIHPHEAGRTTTEDLQCLEALWNEPEILGAGEMGLDFHYDFSDRDAQRRVFSEQLQRNSERDVPIVIHSREAIPETVEILTARGYKDRRVVFHCFTGTKDEAKLIADHGWRISFTGIVTFKNSNWLQEIARDYPTDHIMVETDAPYISPVPVRGKRPCEPAFVAHTARFLADLRKVQFEEFVMQTRNNTIKFFGLPL